KFMSSQARVVHSVCHFRRSSSADLRIRPRQSYRFSSNLAIAVSMSDERADRDATDDDARHRCDERDGFTKVKDAGQRPDDDDDRDEQGRSGRYATTGCATTCAPTRDHGKSQSDPRQGQREDSKVHAFLLTCADHGAVSTDILHLPARVVVTATDRLTSTDGRNVLE